MAKNIWWFKLGRWTRSAKTSDGGYIIIGATESSGAGSQDIWLIKTDASGNREWSKTYGGADYEVGDCVQQTSDGGYVIVGLTTTYGYGSGDIYLIKTDSYGKMEWSKSIGGTAWDYGNSVEQTQDGGYIIAGETTLSGHEDTDIWLIKIDSTGNLVWDKPFGGDEQDVAKYAQQTGDGGYIVVGDTKSYGEGDSDIWMIKTDSSGNIKWDKTYGGLGTDGGRSVQHSAQQSDERVQARHVLAPTVLHGGRRL